MANTSIFTTKMKVKNARNFANSVTDNNTRLYLFAGKVSEWEDDLNPDEVLDNIEITEYDFWRTMIFAKKIDPTDVKLMCKRNDWTTGTAYDMYTDTASDLDDDDTKFFVMNEDYEIFKCLYNADSANSTVKPTKPVSGNLPFTTSDGYIWKYMFELTQDDIDNYLNDFFIPINETDTSHANNGIDVIQVDVPGDSFDGYQINVTSQGGSNASHIIIYDACNATLANSSSPSEIPHRYNNSVIYIYSSDNNIDGQIRDIVGYTIDSTGAGKKYIVEVNNAFSNTPGSNYGLEIAPKVIVNGDGSNCSAISRLSGNSISTIDVLEPGYGYTRNREADNSSIVVIQSNTSSVANATAIISPPGGHGKDTIHELFGYNILVHAKLAGNESNSFTANNDYRRYGLLENPVDNTGSEFNSSFADQTQTFNMNNVSGAFSSDDTVIGQTSNAYGTVVEWFSDSNTLKINEIYGTFQNTETIAISEGGVSGDIEGITGEALTPNEGNMLLIANQSPIERAVDQTEVYSIVFSI